MANATDFYSIRLYFHWLVLVYVGGGTKDDNSTPSIIDEKVLAVLGPSCVGLENPFDGDSSVVENNGEKWKWWKSSRCRHFL
ncbi:unnamed protein product [Acanthoscelides obtectus]|uniref:Uncharacterized protein n=1 Tax=Acanthoscelides obtectus TaxID=200917 RepID=A0A9P0L335_ACAOB|nr:unnamed protein product [Acanthoscelides obtectus]CAK1681011.1 hypothetical protein AOBTE_LOCUS32976 [Acanthoscelides obtectus]